VEQEGKRTKAGGSVWERLGRYKFVALIALVGMICLLWPTGGSEQTVPEEPALSVNDELADMEREMEEILGRIQGVGEVKLMLTLDRGKESVLAEDSSLSYSGDTRAPDDYSRTSEPVILSGEEDAVIVRQEVYPKFRGALVVCSGGGDSVVQLRVIEAVSALTGLGADKISVVKWQE